MVSLVSDWWASDAPTWLGAVGTVGALGVAMAVLWREQTERRERRRGDRVSRARLVSLAEPEGGEPDPAGRQLQDVSWRLLVRNDGTETVSACRLKWEWSSLGHAHAVGNADASGFVDLGRILPGARGCPLDLHADVRSHAFARRIDASTNR